MTHPEQQSKEALINELTAAGAVFRGGRMHCLRPENHRHGDRNPSAGIYEKNGVWRWKCFSCGAGGDVFDVRALRTGQPLAEVLKAAAPADSRPHRQPSPPQQPRQQAPAFASMEDVYTNLRNKYGGGLEATHEYTTAAGEHVQYVLRWRDRSNKKIIRPAVQTEGKIELRFPEGRVLYNLPRLAGAGAVVVVEGEKCADVLTRFGFAATTSAGGCKAAARTDWRPLAGKEIIIWPDADPDGDHYAQGVKQQTEPLGCRVRLIDPAGLDLQDGEDAADYVLQLERAGYGEIEIKQNLAEVFRRANATGPAAELQRLIAEIGAGRWQPVETGFPALDDLVQVLPGSLNLLCGGPGASKSLLVLQIAAQWLRSGIKAAIYELEKDRVFHLRRALAQEAEVSLLTRNRWVQENPQQAAAVMQRYADFADNFGRMLYADPDKVIFQGDVVDWVQARADNGCRVVVIDPATQAQRTADPWKSDAEFVQALARIATRHRLVIFLVVHPSKAIITAPELNQIAGGAAYSRFSDNVLWLENHPTKNSLIRFATGPDEAEHNRTVHVLKSRDGSGTGARIAYRFDPNNLQLRELGLIQKKQKK